MKKVLFYQWNAFMQKGMERALQRRQIEYEVFFYQFASGEQWEKDDVFVDKFTQKLQSGGYDSVLSVNFVPLIAEACQERGIHYISWIYDSPVHIRSTETMKYSCNTIYCFDHGQVQQYRRMGITTIQHMPLAVDTKLCRQAVAAGGQERSRYRSQIAMVGQMYRSEYAYLCGPLGQYERGYLEAVIQSQLKLYGAYFLDEVLTDSFLQQMNQQYKAASNQGFQIQKRELEYTLGCEVTGRERYMALALLSKRFQTALYAKEPEERLTEVDFRGYVDYSTQMPLVFAESDINLNISLKTIRTGIPLRVLDVMGCGGFVLSNYQEELAEYFVPEEELVLYESMEDMVAKADFYIRHEDLRKQIAVRGLQRVQDLFTFDERMEKIYG